MITNGLGDYVRIDLLFLITLTRNEAGNIKYDIFFSQFVLLKGRITTTN